MFIYYILQNFINIYILTYYYIGAEGTINILPIFLDHVIQPTLRPYQFLTEIYHIDGTAKQKGVVYCEVS